MTPILKALIAESSLPLKSIETGFRDRLDRASPRPDSSDGSTTSMGSSSRSTIGSRSISCAA